MALPTIKHYSFLDYTATIKSSRGTGLSVKLGGSQSYLGKISVSQENNNITKITDVTGSTVYGYSNDHSGSVTFEISFAAEAFENLLAFVRQKYIEDPTNWKDATFAIDIYKAGNSTQPIVSCMGCMLKKRPDWEVTKDVGTRTYEFYVAQIEERAVFELEISSSTL